MVAIPMLSIDSDYTLIRIFIFIASLSVLYEVIDSVLTLKSSSSRMKDIDSEILRNEVLEQSQLLSIFSNYNNIISETPDISDSVYKNHEEKLGEMWKYRT
jgi:hypothetical protein